MEKEHKILWNILEDGRFIDTREAELKEKKALWTRYEA